MGCYDRLIVPRFSLEEIEAVAESGKLLTMEIEFNSDCNFNCIYCYSSNGSQPEDTLGKEEFKDVISQARDLGVRGIVVLGGEPMLYPHLMEMLRFITGLGMEVELFTNGTNMTSAFAAELFSLGVTVVLKMNTFDEGLQDRLSGARGAYKQIQEAFNNLRGSGYGDANGRLGVSTVVCSQNYDELEKLWRWLREQGVTPYFEMITPQGRARNKDDLFVDPIRVRDIFTGFSEIDREFGYEWAPKPPLAGMECMRHQYSCVVTSTGEVYPCVGVNITVGNVRESRLEDIIRRSEVMKDLRNFKQTIKGPCRECEEFKNCYGCRGAAYQLTGDYLSSDPLCWRNSGKEHSTNILPTKVDDFLPHKPPMRIVDRVLEVNESTTVEVMVSKDMVFKGKDGAVDDVAFIEMVAQAMAAHNGFKNAGNGGPQEGFLIGVSNFIVHSKAHAGDSIEVVVKKVAQYGDELAVINGIVTREGIKLAEGEIKVWHKNGSQE